MTLEQKKNLIEEVKELRRKIDSAIQDARQLERNLLIAAGAIGSWLFTRGASSVPQLVW